MTDEDPIIDTLTRELGFRVTGHQVVWYRFVPTNDGNGEEYKWKPMAAKPATVGETAMWDQLVVSRRASADLATQVGDLADWISANIKGEPSKSEGAVPTAIRVMTELLQGRAISPPDRRPGKTHGEEAEPRRG